MIFVHRSAPCPQSGQPQLERRLLQPHEPVPEGTVWIDMVQPTRDEDHAAERYLGISVPTREEMDDIEPSELLFTEEVGS